MMYLQFFSVDPAMRIAIWVGFWFAGALYIGTGVPLETYFLVPHTGETWDDVVQNGQAASLTWWGPIQGTLTLVLDLYMFILPFPLLWNLTLSLNKKLQVTAVFFTGLLGIISSIVALYYRVVLFRSSDSTWYSTVVAIAM